MIWQKLKELRNNKGITQNQLAQQLKVNQRTISNWEKGKAEPSINLIEEIAKIFDVSIDFLLGRTNEQKPNYPDIKLSNNKHEMSFWYNEKLNNLLESLGRLIDNLRKIEKKNKGNIFNNINLNLQSITYLAIKLFGMSSGIENNQFLDDYKLILKNGSIGYEEFKSKYNITNEDLNNLIYFEKHKDDKT